MLTWKKWEGAGTEWDEMLLTFPDYNVYQSFSWGEHRESFGWCAVRMIGQLDGRVICIAQVLVRRLPLGIKFAWVPGGPAGDPTYWASSFMGGLKKVLG